MTKITLHAFKNIILLYCLFIFVNAEANEQTFDVLGSVIDTTKKEISAANTLKDNREGVEKFKEKFGEGWWEFMQANSSAKSGEYCAATFIRARHEVISGNVDSLEDGVAVTLLGPGGDYRGALMAFSPLKESHSFPSLKSGQDVKVTLRQGNETPVTINAIYQTIGNSAQPMIAFAVPTIEALMAGMEDKWDFELYYQNQSIARIEWHSGLHAREELKKCLSGTNFSSSLK